MKPHHKFFVSPDPLQSTSTKYEKHIPELGKTKFKAHFVIHE